MRPLQHKLVQFLFLGGLSACAETQAPGPADGLKIAVAPLALPSIGRACYDIEVTNGADRSGDTVWSRGTPGLNGGAGDPDAICSDQFGNTEGGDISYIGPCDADGPGGEHMNSVTIWFDGLYDAADNYIDPAADNGWQNPCIGAGGEETGCTLNVLCKENADALVEFNFTVMRQANQGFFDVAVNFNDIFCSGKFDCSVEVDGVCGGGACTTGELAAGLTSCSTNADCRAQAPNNLLHNAEGDRDRTFVLGFACTAGPGTDVNTELYLNNLEFDCGSDGDPDVFTPDFSLDTAGAFEGNQCDAGSMALCDIFDAAGEGDVDPDRYVYQLAVYRGEEALSTSDTGEPANKKYWNLALGVKPAIADCQIRIAATADDTNDPDDGIDNRIITPGFVYPVVTWDVDAGTCTQHPLSSGVSSGFFANALHRDLPHTTNVSIQYTSPVGGGRPVTFWNSWSGTYFDDTYDPGSPGLTPRWCNPIRRPCGAGYVCNNKNQCQASDGTVPPICDNQSVFDPTTVPFTAPTTRSICPALGGTCTNSDFTAPDGAAFAPVYPVINGPNTYTRTFCDPNPVYPLDDTGGTKYDSCRYPWSKALGNLNRFQFRNNWLALSNGMNGVVQTKNSTTATIYPTGIAASGGTQIIFTMKQATDSNRYMGWTVGARGAGATTLPNSQELDPDSGVIGQAGAEFILFDWSRTSVGASAMGGLVYPEKKAGLRMNRVRGIVGNAELNHSMLNIAPRITNPPSGVIWSTLAQNGLGQAGYDKALSYRVRMQYSTSRVQVWITPSDTSGTFNLANEVLAFDEVGTFPAGNLGFYNMSASTQFTVIEPSATPAGTCTCPTGSSMGTDGKCWLPPKGMVTIPAGSFVLGHTTNPSCEVVGNCHCTAPHCNNGAHTVNFTRKFWIGSAEVTQNEWMSVMGVGSKPFYHQGDGRRPVENVTWESTLEFLNRLSARENLTACYTLTGCSGSAEAGTYLCSNAIFSGLDCKGYRLPTNAEWEYAARAGAQYSWEEIGRLEDFGWLNPWTNEMTHPVRLKRPNPWGIYDTLGNVSEFVWDRPGPYPFPGPVTDPVGPAIPDELRRQGRGPSYFFGFNSPNTYFTLFAGSLPQSVGPWVRAEHTGFRMARTVP